MAELLLKVGDSNGYECGDCLVAFSDKRIERVNAEMLCKPIPENRNGSGLLTKDCLAFDFLKATQQYMFKRVSATEITRRDLQAGTTAQFGEKDIDVRQFLAKRKQNESHLIFGEDGSEIWFGGKTDDSKRAIKRVWSCIEGKTNCKQSEERFQLWSMGRLDVRHHLAVRVNGLTDKQVQSFVEPQYEVDHNGCFCWHRVKKSRIVEHGVSESEFDPPDERDDWIIVEAKRRRRSVKWKRLLKDIDATEKAVCDKSCLIGHEYMDAQWRNGIRYTSKTQALQPTQQVQKKRAIERNR